MNSYRKRILSDIFVAIKKCESVSRVLDFGAGDGWFAHNISEEMSDFDLCAVDVKLRENSFFKINQILPAGSLPFENGCFDLVYAIDVLHHCTDPEFFLRELTRVTNRYLLIKDHNYDRFLGKISLSVLDELGNRKFGIPSNYKYQKQWLWHKLLLDEGWKVVDFDFPHKSHVGVLGALTNSLQYMALYEKP